MRLTALLLAACGVAVLSAQTSPAPAAMMTQRSVNIFRRFAADRTKELEFYADVVGVRPLTPLTTPGGGQMSLFAIETSSQLKLTPVAAGRQEKSGPVLDVTGLRVYSFFYCSESQIVPRFTSHGYAAPEFHDSHGRRSAMVTDPDGQWVELVIASCGDAAPARFEVGATVSDIEKSRAFYREFVGLKELPPADSQFGRTYRFALGAESANILNLWAGHPGAAADTYTAGIQYVVSDVDAVDARAKANHVTIATPLGMFGAGLRTIWLGDPDGITNYFAQILRATPR